MYRIECTYNKGMHQDVLLKMGYPVTGKADTLVFVLESVNIDDATTEAVNICEAYNVELLSVQEFLK